MASVLCKLLLLGWDLGWVSLRADLSTAVSQFAALWVCGSKPHWFSRQMLGGLASQRQVLRAGSLVWGTNPSLLGENLWVWGPSCRRVAGPMVRFMARQPQSILLASQWAFASVLTQTSCSAGVQVLFGGDCSVSGCGFGVSSEESSSESSCVAILEAHSTLFSFSSFSCFLPDQLIFKKWLINPLCGPFSWNSLYCFNSHVRCHSVHFYCKLL